MKKTKKLTKLKKNNQKKGINTNENAKRTTKHNTKKPKIHRLPSQHPNQQQTPRHQKHILRTQNRRIHHGTNRRIPIHKTKQKQ